MPFHELILTWKRLKQLFKVNKFEEETWRIPRRGEPNEAELSHLPAPEGLSLQHYQVNCRRDPTLRRWTHVGLSIPFHPAEKVTEKLRPMGLTSSTTAIAQGLSFTCSVKAKRKGEYISCPNDRRHLAPSPNGSILRKNFPWTCKRYIRIWKMSNKKTHSVWAYSQSCAFIKCTNSFV